MPRGAEDYAVPGGRRPSAWESGRASDRVVGVLIGLVVLAAAWVFIGRFGLPLLTIALGGVTLAIIIGYASLREMSLALIVWLLIMSGFRWVGMIFMPGLPDLSLDRLLLVWIIVIFILRTVVQGKHLPGPYAADVILLLNTVYVLMQMQTIGSAGHFHHWVLSMLTPFFGFLYGKYTVNRDAELRNLMLFLLLLSFYYGFISIAEHFKINALIWPKTILDTDKGLYHVGRSRGPVLHPPMFGQLIAMLVLVWFFFLARARSLGLKAVLSVGLAVLGLGFLFTYTRGPWVAAIVGIVFMVALSRNIRRVVAIVAVIAVLAGLLGAMQAANTEFLQERLSNTKTIENRFGFLANTMAMVRDHPIFGIGYFRYMETVGEYNRTHFIPIYGMVRKNMAAHVPIHDIYLGRLAEEGIVGSILQWSFYFVILRAFLAKWRARVWSRWFDRDMMVLIGAIMVTYLVGGMIIDYRYFDLINVLFYLMAGIVYGYDPAAAAAAQKSAAAGPGGAAAP